MTTKKSEELPPWINTVIHGDALEQLKLLPDKSVHCCVTSPPYWQLRDYKVDGQIGLEVTPEAFIKRLVEVFREVKRVLRDDGTIWVNMGDSYASQGKNRTEEQAIAKSGLNGGLDTQKQSLKQNSKIIGDYKAKDLMGMPWMLAFALRADGWTLRQDIIWHKTNCMPESANDRCTKNHEYIFLLSKNNSTTLLWRHKYSREWVWNKPKILVDPETLERIWVGYTYFYDNDAVATPIAESTKNDARVQSETYSDIRAERGFIGKPSGGTWMLKAKYKKSDAWDQREGVSHNTLEWATAENQGSMRTPRPVIDTRGGNQGTGDIPAIGKGNRKTFRGGGAYVNGNAFDNDTDVQNDSIGNEPNITGFANKRSVWTVATYGFKEAHFATFPPALIVDCIKAGCPPDGIVLDPFFGAGTTGVVAKKLGRNFVGIELNKKYIDEIAVPRLKRELGFFY